MYPAAMGLRDQLAGTIPQEMLPYVSDRFDVIGDVAILTVPPELAPWKETLARAVAARRKNIRTVLEKRAGVAGGSRTARYGILLGTTTETVHRESGFSYRLDVRRMFFSARMGSERQRVAGLIRPGERVFVPFAGVGPFAIPAAARGAVVRAAEMNPDAFRYLVENIALNHVEANCHAIHGDVLDTAAVPCSSFDRLIVPAPYGMDRVPDVLLPLLSPEGTAHFYTFGPAEKIPGLAAAYADRGMEVVYHAACGNVAPGISRIVFDIVRKNSHP